MLSLWWRMSSGSEMTRSELTKIIYRKHGGISKKEAAEIVDKVFESIKDRLLSGERVEISGFGAFEVADKSGRRGRNPQTGEVIFIPPRRALSFRPSRVLKDGLNNS